MKCKKIRTTTKKVLGVGLDFFLPVGVSFLHTITTHCKSKLHLMMVVLVVVVL